MGHAHSTVIQFKKKTLISLFSGKDIEAKRGWIDGTLSHLRGGATFIILPLTVVLHHIYYI